MRDEAPSKFASQRQHVRAALLELINASGGTVYFDDVCLVVGAGNPGGCQSQDDKIAISLPSLRADSFTAEIASRVAQVRKTGFTFAPEAASGFSRTAIA